VSDIAHGLTLSAIGIGLTFLALGLLILGMTLLARLGRRSARATGQPPGGPDSGPAQPRTAAEEEVAAAVAVALAQLRSIEICRSGLGTGLEDGRGRWWKPVDIRPQSRRRMRE
jgi:Na+-transporting methylmalonyl-CoA/oxaloacetate decarboxylase gamma subunit